MEFFEDHGFAKAWIIYNGTYLLTFPDSTVEEFSTKREYQYYVRKIKRKLGIKILKVKGSKLRRIKKQDDETI